MKKHKLLLSFFIALLGVVFVRNQYIYAIDVVETDVWFVDFYAPNGSPLDYAHGLRQISNFFITKWFDGQLPKNDDGTNNTGQAAGFIQRYDSMGKSKIYCIEPTAHIRGPLTGYKNFTNVEEIPNITITQEQWENIKLYAYYGYGYGNHTSDIWYGVTQCMIWEESNDSLVVTYGTTGYDEGASDHSDLSLYGQDYKIRLASYYNEIKSLAENHKIKPSFDENSNLTVGIETAYVDNNGVLSQFSVGEVSNCSARIEGNILYVTPEKPGDVSVKLTRGDPSQNGGTIYTSATSQNIMVSAELYSEAEFKGNAKGYRIRIKKNLESTTGDLGDSKIEDVEFEIYSDSDCKNLVTTLKTDTTGQTPLTDYLPYNTYYIKEVRASEGTNLNTKIYSVTPDNAILDENNDLIITITIDNTVKESYLKIKKYLGGTDYDDKTPLKGAQFSATLISDNSKIYYSDETDENGECTIDDIPYGKYIIEEIKVPDKAYKVESFEVYFYENGKTYEYILEDPSKLMQIAVNKVVLDEVIGKTDAKVSGAYFTVYTDEKATQEYLDKDGNPVIIGPTDNTGYAISETMRTGTYYLKETTFPEGINPDALVPGEEVTFREKIYKASYDNKEQGEDIVVVSLEGLVNIPNLGSIEVIKYDQDPNSTEESPAAGAKLELTLKSNPDCVYTATINEYGYAEFYNEDLRNLGYEYTIPYGDYEIREIKESDPKEHTSFYFQPEDVNIVKDTQKEYRILSDEPTPAWLRIVKKDKDTGADVKIEGAKFKIWDVANEKWVSLMESPSGNYIEEFETNEEGYFYTPQELQPGEYVVYETKPPKGYYLDDELRIPENEEDLGNSDVSGYKVVIDKVATGVAEDEIYPEGGIATGSLVIEVPMENTPLMGQLEIYKTGEMLSEAITAVENVKDGNEIIFSEEKATPVYKLQGLKGVKYEIYAAEDIKSPDGRITYVTEGTLVDTVITEEDGYATTKELYLGEYEIREVEVPKGYTINSNIPNVTLTNENPYNRVEVTKEEYTNDRQKLGLTFEKVFEDIEYTYGEDIEQKALFGIFTKEPIYNYKGNEIIKRNMLMDLVWVDENGDVTSEVDLPEGTYVVRELYTTYPYTVSAKETEFTLKYSDDPNQEFVVVEGEEYVNTPDFVNLNLIKISTSQLGNIIVVDGKIEAENFDEEQQAFLDSISKMTPDELKQYIKSNDIKVISGAKYGIYLDENCTQPLYIKNGDDKEAQKLEMLTDEYGIISLERLPIGQYFIKEIVAPVGYELSDEVVSVNLDENNRNATVYRLLYDKSVLPELLTKLDVFTGEAIPDCVFEIRDEEGNLLLKSVTDGNGKASIPLDIFENGKTYTYTEVEAPDIYNLNTEPHKFVASFDEETLEWTAEKIEVENTRKTREVIVRKVDAETGEPLQGCVFTIAMIDPETGEQKVNVKTGEPIYLVENAVTDENGEYVIPEAPMGTYKFTEIKAPEGYEMDEDLTGLVFTIDNNSPETIIFEVTNTGDIAVMVVSAVAILSVCGIAFVMIRNKRKANE